MKFSVPRGDGETLFHPPWEKALELVEANHSLLRGCSFDLRGTSFHELRASARRKVAQRAGREVCETLRIVVGAHQPGFHSPGILFKYAVLEDLARHHLSLNFVVDSDVCGAISVRVPYLRGEIVGLREVPIFPDSDGLVVEAVPAPAKETVDRIYDEIEELLRSLGRDELIHAFGEFRLVHDRVYAAGRCAPRVLTDYRRGYYPTPHVHDGLISSLSRSGEFRTFACDIIEKIEAFHEAHNLSLNEHRRLHHVRSSANPFPDLAREGELWELPFWEVDTLGRRRRLYAGGTAGNRFVVAEGASEKVRPVEPESAASLRLRPRAVCLTMFLRLFVGDLFVHGVGGGNYDQVTDRIIRKYYGVTPPGYAVCSRTKFPVSFQTSDLEGKMEVLKDRLRRMRYAPEQFSPAKEPLVEEAQRILSECEGKPSAAEHVRLREIRRSLLKQIDPEITSAENELAGIEKTLRRHAVLQRRDFPYFFYPRTEL